MISRDDLLTMLELATALVLPIVAVTLPFGLSGRKSKTREEAQSMNKTISVQQDLCSSQTHVHEFEGRTKLAEEGEDRHNHRFTGVTSQFIPDPGGHRHAIFTNTDFFQNHHHGVGVITGLPIPVGNNKHVHFVDQNTTIDDGHFHPFQFTTLIDDPLS